MTDATLSKYRNVVSLLEDLQKTARQVLFYFTFIAGSDGPLDRLNKVTERVSLFLADGKVQPYFADLDTDEFTRDLIDLQATIAEEVHSGRDGNRKPVETTEYKVFAQKLVKKYGKPQRVKDMEEMSQHYIEDIRKVVNEHFVAPEQLAWKINIVFQRLKDEASYWKKQSESAVKEPVPMQIHCPVCGTRHIDEGEYATKKHKAHSCESCGLVWQPSHVATVGVKFFPGTNNVEKVELQKMVASSTSPGVKKGDQVICAIALPQVTENTIPGSGALEAVDGSPYSMVAGLAEKTMKLEVRIIELNDESANLRGQVTELQSQRDRLALTLLNLENSIPPTKDLLPEVRAFATLMNQKLIDNKHKGRSWKENDFDSLYARAKEEMSELRTAVKARSSQGKHIERYRQRISNEAADVGNFMMFVADVYGALAYNQDEVEVAWEQMPKEQ